MNTANLQLEGLYVVLSALLVSLRDKGVFESRELESILVETERRLASDPERNAQLRDANVDAICFPARYLRQALHSSEEGGGQSFVELATRVGHIKRER
ncbi:hypothetical protein [Methylocystis echinoides]|jgi:hypothetical protein|uniref:hypothetical protein n=1 Tax=Methylocystis echinoides TaxID=29468 RepID=UPI00342123BE